MIACGIHGQALEDIPEGHAEQQGREETADQNGFIPDRLPERTLQFAAMK